MKDQDRIFELEDLAADLWTAIELDLIFAKYEELKGRVNKVLYNGEGVGNET